MKEIHVHINSKEQLKALSSCNIKIKRIYLDYHLFLDDTYDFLSENKDIELFAALPYMARSEQYVDAIKDILSIIEKDKKNLIKGFLVRNLEELGFFEELSKDFCIVSDYGLYTFNSTSVKFLVDNSKISECCLPYELNKKEMQKLLNEVSSDIKFSFPIYGRIPMMISANCILKTDNRCSGCMGQNHREYTHIIDRKNNKLQVICDCQNCANVIYNSAVTSMHNYMADIEKFDKIYALRIDFTTENYIESMNVLNFWERTLKHENTEPPYKEFTAGHFKRGVE